MCAPSIPLAASDWNKGITRAGAVSIIAISTCGNSDKKYHPRGRGVNVIRMDRPQDCHKISPTRARCQFVKSFTSPEIPDVSPTRARCQLFCLRGRPTGGRCFWYSATSSGVKSQSRPMRVPLSWPARAICRTRLSLTPKARATSSTVMRRSISPCAMGRLSHSALDLSYLQYYTDSGRL